MRILYTYFVSKAKKFLLSSIDVGFLNSNCRNYVKNFLEFNHLVSNNANNATHRKKAIVRYWVFSAAIFIWRFLFRNIKVAYIYCFEDAIIFLKIKVFLNKIFLE